jgi:energy-converting hydrogenase Eha subunit A
MTKNKIKLNKSISGRLMLRVLIVSAIIFSLAFAIFLRIALRISDMKNKKKYDVDVVFGEPISSEGKTVEELTKEIQNAILELQNEYRK